jgi:hypothetical protein
VILADGEDLADVVDQSLHLADVLEFHHSTTMATLMTLVVATMYRRRVSPGSGEARTDGLMISSLSSLSAFYVSFV